MPLSYHESTIIVATASRMLVLMHGRWKVDSPEALARIAASTAFVRVNSGHARWKLGGQPERGRCAWSVVAVHKVYDSSHLFVCYLSLLASFGIL